MDTLTSINTINLITTSDSIVTSLTRHVQHGLLLLTLGHHQHTIHDTAIAFVFILDAVRCRSMVPTLTGGRQDGRPRHVQVCFQALGLFQQYSGRTVC